MYSEEEARVWWCLTGLVVSDEYNFADVVVHRRHRVRDLVQYKINFTLDLVALRDATYQLLYDLRVSNTTARVNAPSRAMQ